MTGAASERGDLLLRILADPQPAAATNAAYLFVETEPDRESVFITGRELLQWEEDQPDTPQNKSCVMRD